MRFPRRIEWYHRETVPVSMMASEENVSSRARIPHPGKLTFQAKVFLRALHWYHSIHRIAPYDDLRQPSAEFEARLVDSFRTRARY